MTHAKCTHCTPMQLQWAWDVLERLALPSGRSEVKPTNNRFVATSQQKKTHVGHVRVDPVPLACGQAGLHEVHQLTMHPMCPGLLLWLAQTAPIDCGAVVLTQHHCASFAKLPKTPHRSNGASLTKVLSGWGCVGVCKHACIPHAESVSETVLKQRKVHVRQHSHKRRCEIHHFAQQGQGQSLQTRDSWLTFVTHLPQHWHPKCHSFPCFSSPEQKNSCKRSLRKTSTSQAEILRLTSRLWQPCMTQQLDERQFALFAIVNAGCGWQRQQPQDTHRWICTETSPIPAQETIRSKVFVWTSLSDCIWFWTIPKLTIFDSRSKGMQLLACAQWRTFVFPFEIQLEDNCKANSCWQRSPNTVLTKWSSWKSKCHFALIKHWSQLGFAPKDPWTEDDWLFSPFSSDQNKNDSLSLSFSWSS